jgi:hypothetical protein
MHESGGWHNVASGAAEQSPRSAHVPQVVDSGGGGGASSVTKGKGGGGDSTPPHANVHVGMRFSDPACCSHRPESMYWQLPTPPQSVVYLWRSAKLYHAGQIIRLLMSSTAAADGDAPWQNPWRKTSGDHVALTEQ